MAKTTKTIEHPLEEYFNIENKSTELTVSERSTELVNVESYDEKDQELESDYQEIYDKALDGYDDLSESVNTVEGKYKARLSENAIQYLNTALNAASLKAKLKEHKDKLDHSSKQPPSRVTNNTLIVEDRNMFLRQLRQMETDENDNGSEDYHDIPDTDVEMIPDENVDK